jgi:hypothetical protein
MSFQKAEVRGQRAEGPLPEDRGLKTWTPFFLVLRILEKHLFFSGRYSHN